MQIKGDSLDCNISLDYSILGLSSQLSIDSSVNSPYNILDNGLVNVVDLIVQIFRRPPYLGYSSCKFNVSVRLIAVCGNDSNYASTFFTYF